MPESAGQSDTPETDKAVRTCSFLHLRGICATLERQRDEARADLESSNAGRLSKELAEAKATIAKLHKLSNRLDELLPPAANPSLTTNPGTATD